MDLGYIRLNICAAIRLGYWIFAQYFTGQDLIKMHLFALVDIVWIWMANPL